MAKLRKLKKGDFVRRRFTDHRYFGLIISTNRGNIKVENIGVAKVQFGEFSEVMEITLLRMNHYDIQREVKRDNIIKECLEICREDKN